LSNSITITILLIISLWSYGYSVVFEVDMSQPISDSLFSPEEGDLVRLAGNFNNWDGSDYILYDNDADSIYSSRFGVTDNPENTLEYKFQILKSSGKVLWEKNPNPDNSNYGCRRTFFISEMTEIPLATFDYDKYYLATINKSVIFSVKEMQEDFLRFREILENKHCCLYEYTGKTEMDALFEQQYGKIIDPMQPHEFFRILTLVTASIGCGHTAVWMPGGFWDIDPDNLFPLRIKLMDDQLIVSGSYSDSLQVPFGSIIHEINGKPVKTIVSEIICNYSADAFNIHFRKSQLERRFSLLYSRRYGFPEHYTVLFSSLGKVEMSEKTLDPVSVSEVKKVVFDNFHHPPLELDIREDINTAIMKIKTFIYYDRVPYFTSFLDSSFTLIKENKIQNLILDLRNNDGGDPFCSAPLFSYLQSEPLPYFAEPYGKYSDLAKSLPLPENRFEGSLYTLIDGRCFSTNAHFCALLKYHKIGKFIGTPTGANYKCNAGKNTEYILPNTGILLNIGTQTYATAVKDMDKMQPLIPDYLIVETFEDFINHRDVYLDKAYQIINKKSKFLKE